MYAASAKQMKKPRLLMSGSSANGFCREFIIGSQQRPHNVSHLSGSSASEPGDKQTGYCLRKVSVAKTREDWQGLVGEPDMHINMFWPTL